MSGQGYQGSEQIWEHPREVVGSPAPMAPPKNGVSGGVPSAAMGDWQGQVEAPVGGVPGVAFSVPQMPGMQQVQGAPLRLPLPAVSGRERAGAAAAERQLY
jgi:hypothetical protein